MVILLSTVTPMMKKALEIFEKTTRRSNEELNLNLAMQKLEQIHTVIMNYIDKARTLGTFMLNERNKKLKYENYQSDNSSTELNTTFQNEIAFAGQAVQSVFQIDQDILAVELYETKNAVPFFVVRETKEDKWKALGIESSILDKINGISLLPLIKIIQNQFLIASLVHLLIPSLNKGSKNEVTSDDFLKLLVVGAPLATQDNGEVSIFVVAYVPLDRLQNFLMITVVE